MVLSSREKLIAIVLGTAVAVLVLDRLVYTPLTDWADEIRNKQADLTNQEDQQHRLFDQEKRLRKIWNELSTEMKSNPSEAEDQVQHAIIQWAAESGVSLQSVHPQRKEKKNDFWLLNFDANGTGTTAAVSKLLWRMETAKIPLRIDSVTVTGNDGVDHLQVQLKLSTLARAPVERNNQPPRARTTVAQANGAGT